ncbi:10634_t:CDS:2 [Cetraspora pellucida]|uniref:10634_t:CDS:1 n=1 Tax=Cetraspora pellucida TaxID=1433469 RepID=A0A9N9I204_9GLOM|nr:10634_t:CDS:2 [Cetraspora pellucida]
MHKFYKTYTTLEKRQKVFDLSNNKLTKQSNHQTLSELSLKVAISEYNIGMYEALYENFVDTTFIFDK